MFLAKRVLPALISLGLLSGCITTVKHINKKPERYHEKKVYVRGEVVSSLDLLDINCFTIKSKKRTLLVVTDNLLPLKRDKLWVTGTINKNYVYKKRNLLVLKEKKKRLKKPDKLKKMKKNLKLEN